MESKIKIKGVLMKKIFLILSLILNLNFSQTLNASDKYVASKSLILTNKNLKNFYLKYKLQTKIGSLVFCSGLVSLYFLQTNPEQFKKEVLLTCQSFLSVLLTTTMLVFAAQADIEELN